VRRAAATLISGLQVGSLFEQQKVFDVVVWGTPKTRQNLAAIRDLVIDTPGGGHVRLGDVADVRVNAAPTVIQREAISPYIDIGFDIRGRANNAVLRDIKTAMENFSFPLEYHAEMQEDYAVQRTAGRNILISALLAGIGILLLLQASFTSWRLALATFLALPIVLTGGVLAAFLSGGSMPLVALFGLFAVLGIGTRNSVLLIRHYQALEQEGENFGTGLVLRGSLERLAPLVASTLTTCLILLPFMLFGNIPGHEIVRPMAIVIAGGLITSAFLNLVLLPPLYLRLGAGRKSGLEHADKELQPVAAGNE
jgi:Cu/Ag efflux pump CusA